tara:strand:+ start:1209 stop:1574 length:366 start_codon:yes stop_codon:yes gene_type:complete
MACTPSNEYNPCVQQGSDWWFQVQYTDSDDVALDITGATIEMQVRENAKSATPLIDLSIGSGITITDAANGTFLVEVTPAQTILLPAPKSVMYDLDIVRTQDNKRVTLLVGTVTIRAEITR